MWTMLCYPNCSTCRKAMTWLDEHTIPVLYRNIKENNPNIKELQDWIPKSSLPMQKWFNANGLCYRDMGLKAKIPSMTEEEMLHLLASNGMLLKRPILITEDRVYVGFREKKWQDLL